IELLANLPAALIYTLAGLIMKKVKLSLTKGTL
ncbi:MAG: hypothetical protein K0R92_1126, partial [Lachnospiraceae bacterium]|nr:hypothetical protein [Lachnospiraceae bacterium]